ncbi:MAG: phospholipase D-like domain-containing protein, partial [Chloroflexota bacterium]
MSIGDGLSGVLRVGSDVFLPVRRLAGPLHRRRRAFTEDPNDQLPPLPAPWEDERWFRGSFPPRRHNVLEPLVDGEAYLSDLLTALRAAEKRVTIVGWALTAMMALERKERQGEAILAEVLRDVSARAEVYVLLWSGAPALFKPTSHMEEGVQEILRRAAPRVRCALDHQASFSHDHHQKAVTIDGHLAYVGGMDLTTFEGDRWDTPEHALRLGPNWHDVQVRMRGEVVRDVEDNFCQRWNVVTGEEVKPLPAQPEGNTPAQIVRTVPAGSYPFAEQGDFGIF